MYVIFVNGLLGATYFHSLENGIVNVTNSLPRAMLFSNSADAHIMLGLLKNLVYNLELTLTIHPLSVDEELEVDDSIWFHTDYCFVDEYLGDV